MRWPKWAHELLVTRLANQGITGLWPHQYEAADLAHRGRNVIISTGTASGKSLAYLTPAVTSCLEGGTVLYLTPTKALAADQFRGLRDLRITQLRAACFDGDTPFEERTWIRQHANYVLTNPDMLHRGILPRHSQWSSFFRRLRMVVVDECHGYRGVFGSHVAQILRRLRRICSRYGSAPVFMLASATASEPGAFGMRLTGLEMDEVTVDASPKGATTFALWEPPLTDLRGEGGAPVRRTATAETADLLADLVLADVRTLAFVRSRRGAETVALSARAKLTDVTASLTATFPTLPGTPAPGSHLPSPPGAHDAPATPPPGSNRSGAPGAPSSSGAPAPSATGSPSAYTPSAPGSPSAHISGSSGSPDAGGPGNPGSGAPAAPAPGAPAAPAPSAPSSAPGTASPGVPGAPGTAAHSAPGTAAHSVHLGEALLGPPVHPRPADPQPSPGSPSPTPADALPTSAPHPGAGTASTTAAEPGAKRTAPSNRTIPDPRTPHEESTAHTHTPHDETTPHTRAPHEENAPHGRAPYEQSAPHARMPYEESAHHARAPYDESGPRGRAPEEWADLPGKVAAYRAGYLSEDRRVLEKALRNGSLLGLATTNALELGVDVSGLDAVLIAGWPGTRASLWQQAGRAGRAGQDALAVLIARDDPLDTYLVHHPEALFGQPIETIVLDPDNPYVLGPHLCAAAAEIPLTEDDLPIFGPAAPGVADALVTDGLLRRRQAGWFWTRRERATDLADIRGSGGAPIQVVESSTGRLLGTVDEPSAHTAVHTGAVYLHQGETFLVEKLDLDAEVALVCQAEPDYTTFARDVTEISVLSALRSQPLGPGHLHFGEVEVTRQVVSYLKRRLQSGEMLGDEPLELPPRTLRTRAIWWTLPAAALAPLTDAGFDLGGSAHAAEHASIGLLPLFATCDRWDIGGVSTELHPDTGMLTVFVYDGHEGGAGFAERGYARAVDWLTATREAIASCECERGCPSCIQSPKCGNGNEPLDKAGALRLLATLLATP